MIVAGERHITTAQTEDSKPDGFRLCHTRCLSKWIENRESYFWIFDAMRYVAGALPYL